MDLQIAALVCTPGESRNVVPLRALSVTEPFSGTTMLSRPPLRFRTTRAPPPLSLTIIFLPQM
jgi:hypothetical protein